MELGLARTSSLTMSGSTGKATAENEEPSDGAVGTT